MQKFAIGDKVRFIADRDILVGVNELRISAGMTGTVEKVIDHDPVNVFASVRIPVGPNLSYLVYGVKSDVIEREEKA